jgi:hypothetical protein
VSGVGLALTSCSRLESVGHYGDVTLGVSGQNVRILLDFHTHGSNFVGHRLGLIVLLHDVSLAL